MDTMVTGKNNPRIWSISDIYTADFGEDEWLVENLIPFPSMTAVSGNPGNFKTWITMAIAKAIAEGKPFLEHFATRQGSVLIIDEEDHIKHIQKRLRQLNVLEELPIFYLSQEGIKIDDSRSYDYILKIIGENNIMLVILDSLVRMHTKEENDAKQMASVMGKFSELIRKDVSVLFTHHHRKQPAFGSNSSSQSLRGSSDILAAVDCHLTVEKVKSENTLIIRQEKLRTAPAINPFKVSIESQPESMKFIYAGAHDSKKTKAEEAEEIIIQILEDEPHLFREEIHERLTSAGVAGKQAIDAATQNLLKKGAIEYTPKSELTPEDRKKNSYRIKQPASQFPDNINGQETGKEVPIWWRT